MDLSHILLIARVGLNGSGGTTCLFHVVPKLTYLILSF